MLQFDAYEGKSVTARNRSTMPGHFAVAGLFQCNQSGSRRNLAVMAPCPPPDQRRCNTRHHRHGSLSHEASIKFRHARVDSLKRLPKPVRFLINVLPSTGATISKKISRKTREELFDAIRARFRKASKNGKGRILDEFVALMNCHRKLAIRLLRNEAPSSSGAKGRDRILHGIARG